jgi:hypothetical protein
MIMDEYGTGHFYTQQTNDFENFKRVNRDITAMDHLKPRHGSVVTITAKEYKALKTVSGTSYTINKLESATEYSYSVRAYAKVSGETVWGNHSIINTATAPETVKLVSVKAKDATKATVKWNGVSADGYEIFMAQGKTGKYKRVKTITKGATVSYTKSSLKAGNTYYFYVRAYKTVGDTKIYGASSNVKTVSIK